MSHTPRRAVLVAASPGMGKALMVSTIAAKLQRHDVTVTGDELQAAIAVARGRCVLKVEGNPVHSISPWQKAWDLD
jgi:hypothetical protein